MKYILLIGTFFLSFLATSQTFPIVGRSNSSLTVQDARFSAQLNLYVPRYADTTTANAGTNKGNDSLAAVIFTYNTMSLWVRVVDAGSKKWQEVGSGGGGGGNTIYTGDGALSGNRTINGGGNSLTVDNVSEFRVNTGGSDRLYIDGSVTTIISPDGTSSSVNLEDAGVEITGAISAFSLAGNGTGVVGVDNNGDLFFSAGGGGTGTVEDVTGTANRITITGTATVNPVVDIAATYVGQTSITTLGTITTGTWNATAIAATRGGTGQTVYVVGDILTANTTTTLTTIAALTSGYVLTSNGPGVIPTFQPAAGVGNLLIESIGTGQDVWTVTDDTLQLRRFNNSTFITASTIAESIVLSLSATGTPSASTALFGDNTWKTIPAAGATVALDNLAAVAINASLLPATDNAIDLGDATHIWNDIYGRNVILDGSTSGTTTLVATAVAGTTTITFPATTGTVPLLGLAQTFSANQTTSAKLYAIGGLFSYSVSEANSNLIVGSANAITLNTVSQYLFGGASGVNYRMGMGGNSATTLTAGYNYGAFVIADQGSVEAATGTHFLQSNLAILAPTFTQGAGATTNAATVYIEGPPAGTATITNPVNSLWIETGNVLFSNGSLSLATAGNKLNIATGSNASIGVSGAMTAGTITISTTAVTANSKIFLTHATVSGTLGILSVGTITAGTSFVINSSNAADVSTVNWWIIN